MRAPPVCRLRIAGPFLSLLLLAGCTHATRILSAGRMVDEPYLLQSGDQLEISVFGNLQMAPKVTVGDDGMFLFPNLGQIVAANRPIKEVEGELKEKLERKYSSQEQKTGQEETPSVFSQRVVSPGEVQNSVYRLLPGDSIKVSVWNHSELEADTIIREDGTFPYPLLGDIQAAGHSVREIQQEIMDRLNKDYIVNPEVTASLGNTTFTILGQVVRPGPYPTDGTLDLLAALSLAGGASSDLSSGVDIIRIQGSEKLLIRVDADQILQGKQPNLRILPHDTIYVRSLASGSEGVQVSIALVGAKFTAIGEVTQPGQYNLEGSLDLLTAVSQAGGITKFGANKVEIIRQRGKERVVIRASIERILRGKDPNVRIHPRDTINVRRRFI